MTKSKTVSIRFTQKSYVLLKSYPFRPAGVFAEFIDNSIQSYQDNKVALKKKGYKFKITIEKKGKDILISDNAAGISDKFMLKAFEPGNIDYGKKGLNEFGIGMKNAAVWISDFYSVKTCALNENYSKQINFDYKDVIENEVEELEIEYSKANIEETYTRITLKGLRGSVDNFDFDSIGKELSSIYRIFLATGELTIKFCGKDLQYEYPKVMNLPYFAESIAAKKNRQKQPANIKWRYDFSFKFRGKNKNDKEKTIKGFVAILDKINKRANGVSYFRNGRVVEGAGDQKVFPASICGNGGSHQHKRIFGELHFDESLSDIGKGKLLDTQDVTAMIHLLSEQLKRFQPPGTKKIYNLLKQASELRLSDDIDEDKTIDRLKKQQKKSSKKEDLFKEEKKFERLIKNTKNNVAPAKKNVIIKIETGKAIERVIPIGNGKKYLVKYTLHNDVGSDELYTINIRDVKDRGEKDLLDQGITKVIEGSVNLLCSFITNNEELFKGRNTDGLCRFIEYMMITEAIVHNFHKIESHFFRETLNDIINN